MRWKDVDFPARALTVREAIYDGVFERVYALTESVAPHEFIREADDLEADRFLIKKEISFSGISKI